MQTTQPSSPSEMDFNMDDSIDFDLGGLPDLPSTELGIQGVEDG